MALDDRVAGDLAAFNIVRADVGERECNIAGRVVARRVADEGVDRDDVDAAVKGRLDRFDHRLYVRCSDADRRRVLGDDGLQDRALQRGVELSRTVGNDVYTRFFGGRPEALSPS